jgi:DNA-binding SARP family transcriptional activator
MSADARMVYVTVLGPLEVLLDDGRPVRLQGRKPRALLAMLALCPGTVVSADRLAEALWGEEPSISTAATLQVYVSQLRKVLGAQTIQTRSPGYVLAVEPERVDAVRFERLVAEGRSLAEDDATAAVERLSRALGLWRGPALADFAFEDFARSEIDRLEELRLVAVEERNEAELSLGRHVELVGLLRARFPAQHSTHACG